MNQTGFQEYREWLFHALRPMAERKEITAIISAAACRSTDDVAGYLSLPHIQIEPSPVRTPAYLYDSHALFLNGLDRVSEVKTRYERFSCSVAAQDTSIANLQAMLIDADVRADLSRLRNSEALFEVGIALQDDVNMNIDPLGWNNVKALYKARQVFPPEKILIREHPNSVFLMRSPENFGVIDKSKSSLEFVSRCKRLLTVGSSVAFDAALMSVPAYVLGKNYLQFLTYSDFDRKVWTQMRDINNISQKLTFVATNVLVPSSMFLDPQYLRFRLSGPGEEHIRTSHLKSLG